MPDFPRIALNALQRIVSASILLTLLVAGPKALADAGADHQQPQVRPIPMGVSIGVDHLIEINGSLYCSGGTAGAVVVDSAGYYYILSNNHVLANEGTEVPGVDGVMQPALLDQCSLEEASEENIALDRVAILSDFVPINFGGLNLVDAALAADLNNCNGGGDPCLDRSGYILDIGPVDSELAAPAIGMKVVKSGRTTGQTYGDIEAIGVTINVQYDGGIATFTDQVRITSCSKKVDFSDSGDSGSLILTDPRSNGDTVSAPQPVGLLFAGSRFDTFANPASHVLAELGDVQFAACDPGVQNCQSDPNYVDRALSACPSKGGGGGGGNGNNGKGGGRPNADVVGLERARQVANQNAAALFAGNGVVGFGIGADASGNAVIEVYLDGNGAGANVPAQFGGVSTRVVVTGPIYAY